MAPNLKEELKHAIFSYILEEIMASFHVGYNSIILIVQPNMKLLYRVLKRPLI